MPRRLPLLLLLPRRRLMVSITNHGAQLLPRILLLLLMTVVLQILPNLRFRRLTRIPLYPTENCRNYRPTACMGGPKVSLVRSPRLPMLMGHHNRLRTIA